MSQPLQLGICSFSFHRKLAAGEQDIFKFITDCKSLGCTQLDPWNAHLSALSGGDQVMHARNPREAKLEATDDAYIDKVRAAADEAQMPFGCIAVDGTHMHADSEDKWQNQFSVATRWVDIARKLGAKEVRIDAGGPDELTDESLAVTVRGYRQLIDYASERGVAVLTENHWGPTPVPRQVARLLDEVEGLGLLFDTNNWKPGLQGEAYTTLPGRATACHIKLGTDPAKVQSSEGKAREGVRVLYDAGFRGPWGVESVVGADGIDELDHARRCIDLIQDELTKKESAS